MNCSVSEDGWVDRWNLELSSVTFMEKGWQMEIREDFSKLTKWKKEYLFSEWKELEKYSGKQAYKRNYLHGNAWIPQKYKWKKTNERKIEGKISQLKLVVKKIHQEMEILYERSANLIISTKEDKNMQQPEDCSILVLYSWTFFSFPVAIPLPRHQNENKRINEYIIPYFRRF